MTETEEQYKNEARKLARMLDKFIGSIEPRIDNTTALDGEIFEEAFNTLINTPSYTECDSCTQEVLKAYEVTVESTVMRKYIVNAASHCDAEDRYRHNLVHNNLQPVSSKEVEQLIESTKIVSKNKYQVIVRTSGWEEYEVEATSKNEADKLVREGKVERLCYETTDFDVDGIEELKE